MIDPLGLASTSIDSPSVLRLRGAGSPLDTRGPSFGEVLVNEIRRVDLLQRSAEKAATDLAAGSRADVASVLDAARKADEAFRMLIQVRGRVMEAYEELKQIRV